MAYRYYSTRRPVMVGGIPSTEGITNIVNFESGRLYCREIEDRAWGYIEYATPLDPQKVRLRAGACSAETLYLQTVA